MGALTMWVFALIVALVTIVLGTPVKRTVYPGPPSSEVWLYRWARLHQDALRAHGATLFRLVFVDGLLAVAEPL